MPALYAYAVHTHTHTHTLARTHARSHARTLARTHAGSRFLGLVTMAAVIILDVLLMCLTVLAVDNDGDGRVTASELRGYQYDPGALSFVCLFSRVGLVIGGESYWLLGHSLIYLFFGCALGLHVANTRFPSESAQRTQAHDAALRRLLLSTGGSLAETSQPRSATQSGRQSSWVRRLVSYEALLGLLSLIFAGEIAVVAFYAPDGVQYVPVRPRGRGRAEGCSHSPSSS